MTVPYASATERVLKDIEKAKALALKLEDDLVDPESETSEEPKPETSLDKPVRALSERGSVVVEETISRLLEKHNLTAETLSDEQANVKVSWQLPDRAPADVPGKACSRSMAVVPTQRSIDMLLLCRPFRFPRRITAKMYPSPEAPVLTGKL
jgi:hypothetical protein